MFGALRSPRNIVFGSGQRASLPGYVAALGHKVLLVTDGRMAGEETFRILQSGLREAGLSVSTFAGVEAELPAECLVAGVAAAKIGRAHV